MPKDSTTSKNEVIKMTIIVKEIEQEKEILSLTNDVVFKLFFANEANEEQLRQFLKATIPHLTEDDLTSIHIKNPTITKADISQKDFILDMRLVDATGHYINIELQMKNHPHFIERVVTYNAGNLVGQLKRGDDYTKLKASISVVITDFKLFSDEEAYYEYITYRRENGKVFTDIQQYHIIDLTKLPQRLAEASHLWGALFKAKTEEELRLLMAKSEEMAQAGKKLLKLSEEEQAREIARAREESQWAYNMTMNAYKELAQKEGLEEGLKEGIEQGLEKGIEQGKIEVAKKLLARGDSIEEIKLITDLAEQEIKNLE